MDHSLIFYNFTSMIWDWNEEGIEKLEVSEDIVEFLVQNTLQDAIHKDTIEILKFAACLGNREFNSFILSTLFDVTVQEAILVLFACSDFLDNSNIVACRSGGLDCHN